MNNKKKLSDAEQMFRIVSMVIETLAEMQDIDETVLKRVDIDDNGNLIYVTISAALSSCGIDTISGTFGDNYAIVRPDEEGINICINPTDDEFEWINFENKSMTLHLDYTLEEKTEQ